MKSADWDVDDYRAYADVMSAIDELSSRVISPGSDLDKRFEASASSVGTRILAGLPLPGGRPGLLLLASADRDDQHRLEGILGWLPALFGLSLACVQRGEELDDQTIAADEFASLLTSIEVTSSARHELRSRLGTLGEEILLIKLNGRQSDLTRVVRQLESVTQQVEQMRAGDWRGPNRRVRLRELWDEATALFEHRLASGRIAVRYAGPDLTILAHNEALRSLFIQLLLNSVEAFESRKLRKERKISLRIEFTSGTSAVAKIYYSDNAGGLDKGQLASIAASSSVNHSPHEQIFRRGVSTKPRGSGYGLWVARQAARRFDGSIRIIDDRGGMTFLLEIPIWPG